jgi:iron complex transport system permease protein
MNPRRRTALVLLSLSGALSLTMTAALAFGSVPIPLVDLGHALAGDSGDSYAAILWAVRAPRVLLAALVGGALAIVGAALQSVFRNPLAESGLLGVGSGAALGAVVAVQAGWAAEIPLALPAAAFVGALSATFIAYLLHSLGSRESTAHGLLLTGAAVAAVASAGTTVVLIATDEFRVKAVLFWLAGGLEGRGWQHLRLAAPLVLGGTIGLLALARVLDLLSLGEEEAAALGLRIHRARLGILALSALIAGVATAVAGSVSFVGLVAPHILRSIVGSRARRLLPATFLFGATLVVLADLASRSFLAFDIPLGAVTALIGAPYFLVVLRRSEGLQ